MNLSLLDCHLVSTVRIVFEETIHSRIPRSLNAADPTKQIFSCVPDMKEPMPAFG